IVKGERTGRVEGVEGARGVAIATDAKRGFAAAGKKNKLMAFDLESLKVTKEIETDEGPDALVYVSSATEVWCFNGGGKSAMCVDASTLEVKATIKLDGKPEL